jgi:hypothetical protein
MFSFDKLLKLKRVPCFLQEKDGKPTLYCNVLGYWDAVRIDNSIYWVSVSQSHSVTTVQICSLHSHTSLLALDFHFWALGLDAPGLCLGPVSACLSVCLSVFSALSSYADWTWLGSLGLPRWLTQFSELWSLIPSLTSLISPCLWSDHPPYLNLSDHIWCNLSEVGLGEPNSRHLVESFNFLAVMQTTLSLLGEYMFN